MSAELQEVEPSTMLLKHLLMQPRKQLWKSWIYAALQRALSHSQDCWRTVPPLNTWTSHLAVGCHGVWRDCMPTKSLCFNWRATFLTESTMTMMIVIRRIYETQTLEEKVFQTSLRSGNLQRFEKKFKWQTTIDQISYMVGVASCCLGSMICFATHTAMRKMSIYEKNILFLLLLHSLLKFTYLLQAMSAWFISLSLPTWIATQIQSPVIS